MASDKNVAKIVKLQEKIKVELKNLIKEAMQSGMSREDVDASAKEMIQKFLKDNKEVKLEYNKLYKMWERLLYNNFTTMYKISFKTLDRELNKDKISHEVSQALKEVYKSDAVKKESYVFKSKDLIDDKNINASDTPNLKFIRTSAEYGYTQMQIDNYVEKVERTMDKIAQINFVAVNSTGARVSLRNKAEMEVRYQDMLSDLNKLKDEKFVIVSQHRDSSLRCACWQGLIYLKDTDGTDVSLLNWHEWNNVNNHIIPKPIGYTENNQPYYSLKESMEHGLFSYNCRHRFIKYEPGIKVPKQYPYDPNKESASSLIDKQMRQLEQNIRRAKERQTLALTPKELKKWQAKSKKLQAEYDAFCKKHNRVRNDWRTSIGVVERGINKTIKNELVNEELNDYKEMDKNSSTLVSNDLKTQMLNEEKLKNVTIKKIENCEKLETYYSKDFKQIEAKIKGTKLYGFEFRLKTYDSLNRKIENDAKKYIKNGFNYDEAIKLAANNIHDVNRYTYILDDKNFVDTYNKVQKELLNKNYKLFKCKNSLGDMNSTYRGINNQYILNGEYVEIQFHTKQSIEVKEKNHKLYEKVRIGSTPVEKEKMQQEMLTNNENLIVPQNIDKIK